MPYSTPFTRKLTVANAGANVNSTSFQQGSPDVAYVLSDILCPHALQGVSTVKVQVSSDNVTWYDILSDGSAVTLKCVIDSVLPIPDSVQAGSLGWDYIRLVANANPGADIIFLVRFSAAQDDNPIFDDDVIWGSRADAAITDPSVSATQIALLKGILTNLNTIAGGAVAITGTAPVGKSVTVTPTLSVAGLYASGDYVGQSATIMQFAALAAGNGKSVIIDTVTIVDKALQSKALELWLFNADPTVPADNAAWDITDANALKCIAVIPIPAEDYVESVSNSIATVNTRVNVKAGAATTTIFAALVTRDTPTYANGDLQVTIAATQLA